MWDSSQLILQRLNMVGIDMGISESVDEFTALEAANLGKHACEQSIACNVEGYSKAEITRSLVHLTRKLVIS